MLRVGLTGELGSGKSTVARLLAERGAIILSSDEMARAMMQPGHPVYTAILDRFGPAVVLPNGELNRPELARLAFDPGHPRVDELNAVIHPAVLAEQERHLAAIAVAVPDTIAVIESALIFNTKHAGDQPWRKRFDCILLVTAPDEVKIERFLQRRFDGRKVTAEELATAREDASRRLALQRIPNNVAADVNLDNNSGIDELRRKVDLIWEELRARNSQLPHSKLETERN